MRIFRLNKPLGPNSTNHRGQREIGLTIDPARATTFVDGRQIRTTAKEFQALSYLHSRSGALCTKDELARHVWPEYGGAVDDYNIEQLVSRLRRKLEPDHRHPRFLLTVRGLGYRLETAPLSERATTGRARLPSRIAVLIALVLTVATVGLAFWLLLPFARGGSQTSQPIDSTAQQSLWILKEEDDFSSPEKSRFPIGPGSTPFGLIFSRSIEGGEYVVRVLKGPERSGGVSALAPPVSWETFAVQAQARSNGSIQYGLTLFWNSADSLQIRLNPTTMSYELVHSLEGRLISRENSPLVKAGDSTNDLRFELRGKQLSVFVNGTLAETVVLESLGRRPVTPGLFVYLLTEGAESEGSANKVVFDNFQLFAAEGD